MAARAGCKGAVAALALLEEIARDVLHLLLLSGQDVDVMRASSNLEMPRLIEIIAVYAPFFETR